MSQQETPTHRSSISIRLAWMCILAAIFVGFLTSAVSIYLDFKEQASSLEKRIETLFISSDQSAVRAVESSSSFLATEIVDGLMSIPFISRALIIDDAGVILASETKESETLGEEPPLLKVLARNIPSRYAHPLNSLSPESSAELQIFIDKSILFGDFIHRSQLSIIESVIRGLFISALLFAVFYLYLAKPLRSVARQISTIDPAKPGSSRIEQSIYSSEDELALVVKNTNYLLQTVECTLEQQQLVEDSLRDTERQLREVVDGMPVVVAAFNQEGKFLFANKAFMLLVGCSEYEDLTAFSADKLLVSHFGYSEELVIDFWDDLFNEGQRSQLPDTRHTLSGAQIELQVECMPMQLFSQSAGFLVATDISALKTAQKDIEHMAYRDALTGLPNRYSLLDQLTTAVAESKLTGSAGAAIYVDLDRFKPVNDLLGHSVGDAVLKEVALRLKQVVGEDNFVARISGDEFMILLHSISPDRNKCAEVSMALGKEILSEVGRPIFSGASEVRVTASLGILLFPDSAETATEIMKRADTAMYEVKRQSRGSIEFFDEDLAVKLQEQWRLEQELGRAFEHSEFEVHYQPKVEVKTNKMVGVEALLRWNHPKLGIVAAGDFIEVLQSMAVFAKVSAWAQAVALDQVRNWQHQGIWGEDMRIGLNVSPAEFVSNHFADNIRKLVSEAGVQPKVVEFEVLESAAFEDLGAATEVMASLVSDGFRFALDDFGRGFSSMHCLRQLPLNVLKIDKSFITGMGDEFNDCILVEAVIRLAQLLKLKVIAEGVESEKELELLKKFGCDYYQGFHFSQAVEPSEIERMLIAGIESVSGQEKQIV